MLTMEKLLGILPYIYLEEPVQLGDVKFMGIPDWQGRNHAPKTEFEKQYLNELALCFSTTRGLMTSKGGTRSFTYFLLENKETTDNKCLEMARNAITLLRYSLLRPDAQAIDNIESTYLYSFALPPVGNDESRLYRCWSNIIPERDIWINLKQTKFPLPDLYVDCQMINLSQLEDIQEISQKFYRDGLSEKTKVDIILAMEWYNQSFQKYSLRNSSGRLVDIATAFETLFQLPLYNKKKEF
jgi:hypothetical protein